MKIQIECNYKGDITVNFHEIVDNLDIDSKKELAEKLCFDDEVMTHFLEELMDGGLATPTYNYNIHEARLKLSELLPSMNKHLIRSLLHQVDSLKKDRDRFNEWAWKLYHAWPGNNQPELPGYIHGKWPSEEEVNDVVEGNDDAQSPQGLEKDNE